MDDFFCDRLMNSLVFEHNGIKLCNYPNGLQTIFPYSKDCLSNIFLFREQKINNMQSGILEDCCKNCSNLKRNTNNLKNLRFNYIELFYWYECNCACYYCSNRNTTKLRITNKKNVKGSIKIIKVLKYLQKNNLLDEDAVIGLFGGEPTLLIEFRDILKFVFQNNYMVRLNSNGILYEKYISKALKNNRKSTLMISIDAGSPEVFRKIKRVDKFKEVCKNTKKYIKESEATDRQFISKYIILPKVNDNKAEIDNWIKNMADIGVKTFCPTIEHCHSLEKLKTGNLDPKIVEMYCYAKERICSTDKSLNLHTLDFIEDSVKHYFERNRTKS